LSEGASDLSNAVDGAVDVIIDLRMLQGTQTAKNYVKTPLTNQAKTLDQSRFIT
jgi:hypothetical protein